MKLVFISLMSGQPAGGSELLWLKTAETALSEGHDVTVSVTNWGKDTHPRIGSLRAQGAKVLLRARYVPSDSIAKKALYYVRRSLQSSAKEWSFIRKTKPDKVLINQGGSFDILQHYQSLYNLLRQSGTGYVLLSHGHPQFGYLPEDKIYPGGRAVFLQAEHSVFISRSHLRFVERTLLMHLPNSMVTWNPLNLKNRNILPWPETDKPQLALVAALVSGKGHDMLLEILSQPDWQKRDWVLNIYGNGPGKKFVEDTIRYFKLAERVKLHGHVASATDIWEKNQLLLLPSAGEGMPTAMIEAMIAGRPVFVTDVGGVREVVTHNENGFICEAPTVTALQAGLEFVWNQKDRWKQIGAVAHNEMTGTVDPHPEKKLLELLTL